MCRWVLVLCVLAWSAGPVAAQQPSPLDIQCDRLYAVRSEGPLTLLVRMTPASSTLLEGKLEFKLWNGRELLSTLVTDDEVINPPMKTVRYVLPAPELRGYTQQLELTIDFISKQGRLKFGPFSILVPQPSERDLVIGYVLPETARATPNVEQLLEALKFENYSPIPDDKSSRTITSRILPDQLPPDAISNCGFNMMFIAAEGFSAVKESQWTPILEWVEAGGSLCLLPGTDLSPYHITLLNKLLARRGTQNTFLLGPNNELLLTNEKDRRPTYLARRGLGVVAIVPLLGEETPTAKSAEWMRTAAHLWRFRRDQANPLQTTGKWSPTVMTMQEQALQSQGQNYYYRNVRQQQRRLSYMPINSGDQLIQAIVPSNLHIIPLSLIAFVLFLYVLAIGPGDYFILGRFNLRKWTWITFPVTTLVFAGGALVMAEWYMNTGDARRSAYIVDIGIEGQPERVNQFEMLFNSRQKVTETPLSRSLFTSLDHQMYGAGSYQQYNQRQFGQGAGFVGPAEISGRIPGRYTARQLTPKWVPQLNRIMTLNTERFNLKLDWQRFQIKDIPEWQTLLKDNGWKQSIIDPVKKAVGSRPLTIGLYAGGKFTQIYGNQRIFTREVVKTENGVTTVVPQPNNIRQFQQFNAATFDFVADISMLQDAGMFSIVSSLAPHGGRQLEDLSLLDPSDPQQWLLVVGVEDGQDWIVYRKLYTGIE